MIYFLITIISLLIGYWLGTKSNPSFTIGNDIKTFAEGVKRTITPSIPTGIIKPKTAQEIYERNRPQKEREGLEEMKKTLDNSELKQVKELKEKYGV
jgi:hypothetical protein